MRLIDADALHDVLCEHIKHNEEQGFSSTEARLLLHRVDYTPAIEAEPIKHGHWMDADESKLHCSYCHRYVRRIIPRGYDYCPHCGARMDEGDKE